MSKRRVAFLDRDGVINLDTGYVSRIEDFKFLEGTVDGMRLLQDKGYALVVITNQSGIARGLFDEKDYQALTQEWSKRLSESGVSILAHYHCPHLPDARVEAYRLECACRKPAPGLILNARDALNIDLKASVMLGDKESDIEAARRAGVGRIARIRPHRSDYPCTDLGTEGFAFESLLHAAEHLSAPLMFQAPRA